MSISFIFDFLVTLTVNFVTSNIYYNLIVICFKTANVNNIMAQTTEKLIDTIAEENKVKVLVDIKF